VIDVSVVRSFDDLQATLALRAVVYMGEQSCPFLEEFDGNDLAGATHLLARCEGAPAGVIRIRWFAGFAKLERAAVGRAYRARGVARALWQESARVAAAKGYSQMLGYIEPRLIPFWRACAGFEPRAGRPKFYFSDREYVEVIAPISPTAEDVLTIDSSPMVLIRPEGAWDAPGILDASVQRKRAAR